MITDWKLKRDPKHHPVRFLAHLWAQRTGTSENGEIAGKVRNLLASLGEFTPYVIEWMLNPVNWWRFTQQVRADAKLYRVPDAPEIGFLLFHRNRALTIMRRELRFSTAAADVSFCTRLDQLRYDQWKALTTVYAGGRPEWLARIEAAKNLTAIQQVFVGIVDEESIPTNACRDAPA